MPRFLGMRIGMFPAVLLFCVTCCAQTKFEKELQSPYKRVIDRDLAYIITGEERQAFNRLGTDEEREQFLEQFWRRRDPTPDTEENEFKEEHYRRIAYANERYASGLPGWKSDRGRIYIMYGPPDEIDPHPSGGTYQRPPEQGGGQTSTFPFEQWRYRYIEGIGTNIVIEFVDTTMTGEYRMTMDPSEKDALQHVPGRQPPSTTQAASTEFDRLKLFSDLQKPPSVKFKDLEAAITSRVAFNVLPMKVRHDFFRISDSSVLTNITAQFDNKDLQFATKDGARSSTINVFGRVTTLTRRAVNTFERTFETTQPASMSIFQESIPLPPGSYRLNLVVKDVVSGNLQSYETLLTVPRFEEGKLALSSLVIADPIQRLPIRSTGSGQFALGSSKVRPRVDAIFRRDEKLAFYAQVYNPAPNATVEYEVSRETGERVFNFSEALTAAPATQAIVEKNLPLDRIGPGRYSLKLRILNGTGGEAVSARQAFTVK
jgi:GWxTD domain-containing protein